jgi:hypothetical protein
MTRHLRDTARRAAPLALLLAAFVVFFWKIVSFSGVLFYFDLLEFTVPVRDFFFKNVAHGRFPLWSPFLCGGDPLFDEGQAGPLYLPNYLLFTWLPSWWALNASTILHGLAAALGAYLYLARSHSRPAAAIGAMTYVFGSPLIFHLVHFMFFEAYCLFPWLYYFFDRFLEKGRVAEILRAALVLGAMFAAGHQQSGIFSAMALAVFCAALAVEAWVSRRPRLAVELVAAVLCIGVLAAAMSTAIIGGMLHLLPQSSRHERMASSILYSFSLVPDAFARLASPDQNGRNLDGTWYLDGVPEKEVGVYLGLAVWCFLPLLFAGRRRRRDHAHLAVVAFGLLFVLGMAGPFTGLIERVPLLDRMRIPTRFFLPMSLSFAFLTASGLDRLHDEGPSWRRLAVGLLAGAAAWAATAYGGAIAAFGRGLWLRGPAPGPLSAPATALHCDLTARTWLAVALAGAALLLWRARRAPPVARAAAWLAIGGLVFADLASANRQENPVTAPAIYVPHITLDYLRPRLDNYRLYTLQSMGAVSNDNWTHDMTYNVAGAQALPFAMPMMYGLRTANCDMPLILARLQRAFARRDEELMRQMSVKYILFPREAPAEPLHIFEMPNPLPIYAFATEIRPVAGESEALVALQNIGGAAAAVLEDAGDLPNIEPANAAVTVLAEEPDVRRLRVQTDRPAFLIVRENYYPGWQATIDGAPAKIYRTNYLYWGFATPAGAHDVTLSFRPAGFRPALAATVLAFLGTLGLTLFYRPFRRTRPALADAPADPRAGAYVLGAILGIFVILLLVAAARHPDLWNCSSVLRPRWR